MTSPRSVSDGHRVGQEVGAARGLACPGLTSEERGGLRRALSAWPLGLFELTLGTKASRALRYAFDLDLQPFGTGPDLRLSHRPQSHPLPTCAAHALGWRSTYSWGLVRRQLPTGAQAARGRRDPRP